MAMELELDLGQEFTPSQTLKVSPRLVAANYILELSSQELQQAISTELNDNPALELVEVPTCRVCGTEMQGSICPRCIQRQKTGSGSQADTRASSSYDDPAEIAKFVIKPGEEKTECYTFRTPNEQEETYQTSALSGRSGTHHIISTIWSGSGLSDFVAAKALYKLVPSAGTTA